MSYAVEESFVVTSGSTVLYTSPVYPNNQVITNQACLDATPNFIYTLEMKDSANDSWSPGAYLAIYGPYNNLVFKNFMTEDTTETINFTVNTPVPKEASWKYSSSDANGWKSVQFDDSTWSNIPRGSTVMGTQYFRIPFVGVPEMAAVDLRFFYSEGIIAYINGEEIYRDNMPGGEVSSTTTATGSYLTLTYHGIVRSADIVRFSSSVLAVELHVQDLTVSHTMNYDAFMALIAPNVKDTTCMIYGETPTLSSSGGYSESAFNFHNTDYMYIFVISSAWLRYEYTGPVLPAINGIRMYAGNSQNDQATDFGVWGSFTSATADFTKFIDVTGWSFAKREYKHAISTSQFIPYKYYEVRVTKVNSFAWNAVEIQPLICNTAPPSAIVFEESSYSYIAQYQGVDIRTKSNDFSNCTVTPALPSGLSISEENCWISGTARASLETTEFTVHTTQYGGISGTFSLTISECQGTMIKLVRIYTTSASKEGTTVTNAETGEVLFSAPLGESRPEQVTWEQSLCVPDVLLKIETSCERVAWSLNSFFEVYTYIGDNELEQLLRIKHDTYLSLPTVSYVRTGYVMSAYSNWYAKMDSIPADWMSDSTTGWTQGSFDSYPAALNQIQLYKTFFTISSLDTAAGFILLLRYKYGIIVTINGREVFRNNVEGELSSATTAESMYQTVLYRSVSLPIRSVSGTNIVDYLHEGQNTIAVATVAISASQTTQYFDAAIRLMGTEEESRVMGFTVTASSSISNPENVFSRQYTRSIKSSYCYSNWLQVVFENDRREWISSIILTNDYSKVDSNVKTVTVKARNNNDEDWNLLVVVSGLTWSTVSQRRKVWLHNNKPFNQYRFEDFGSGSTTNCAWNLQSLDMMSDRMQMEIPELSFESTSIFQNIEMAEIYPSSSYYTNYTVVPTLPSGIVIDPFTGVLSGTASNLLENTTYTIHATSILGIPTTAEFSLAVVICTGEQSLITVVVQADNFVRENGWRLYQGRGNGTVLQGRDTFPVSQGVFYLDFCLPHGIYTFEGRDYNGDGWKVDCGYKMTVDQGALSFAMGMVNSGPTPTTHQTVFSSYLPFQIQYDDWKISDEYQEGWNQRGYDDSAWSVVKAADIGQHSTVTVYIRRVFDIDSLDDYTVLNVRVRFGAGLVAYFNGRMVARYNMPSTFDASTVATATRDSTLFTVFHVLLTLDGATEAANVIAFELHRHAEQSSTVPVVFDATGVFGVSTCSSLLDEIVNITGTQPAEGSLADLFDMDPIGAISFPNNDGDYVQFGSSNQIGMRFNAWGFWANKPFTSWSVTFGGRMMDTEEDRELTSFARTNFDGRSYYSFETPLGMIPFSSLRLTVDSGAITAPSITSLELLFCKSVGKVCPGVDGYPAVGDGQVSPALCPAGYRGYAYRNCTDGTLGEVQMDRCFYKEPENLRYKETSLKFVVGTVVRVEPPKYDNLITEFYFNDNSTLPQGLELDSTTGAITGVPTEVFDLFVFTVMGANPSGVTATTLTLSVRLGSCQAEAGFPTTVVGERATSACSYYGSFVGTQSRLCTLGEKDGEWGKTTGFCTAVSLLVVLVIVAVIVVVVICVCIIRRMKKTKVTGGVKGKKSIPSKADKESKMKEVKI